MNLHLQSNIPGVIGSAKAWKPFRDHDFTHWRYECLSESETATCSHIGGSHAQSVTYSSALGIEAALRGGLIATSGKETCCASGTCTGDASVTDIPISRWTALDRCCTWSAECQSRNCNHMVPPDNWHTTNFIIFIPEFPVWETRFQNALYAVNQKPAIPERCHPRAQENGIRDWISSGASGCSSFSWRTCLEIGSLSTSLPGSVFQMPRKYSFFAPEWHLQLHSERFFRTSAG